MTVLKRILIVDDEEELVSTLQERLELRGYSVIGVLDGKAAEAAVVQTDFDAVLLDVRLKGEDGIEVMQRLRDVRPTLPVLLITGHMSLGAGEAGRKAGAADFVLKPVQLKELIDKMNAAAAARPEA